MYAGRACILFVSWLGLSRLLHYVHQIVEHRRSFYRASPQQCFYRHQDCHRSVFCREKLSPPRKIYASERSDSGRHRWCPMFPPRDKLFPLSKTIPHEVCAGGGSLVTFINAPHLLEIIVVSLCAQLTRDLSVIAKFLLIHGHSSYLYWKRYGLGLLYRTMPLLYLPWT